MLVKVSVNITVSVRVLFVEGFADKFEVFDIEKCEVSSIYV